MKAPKSLAKVGDATKQVKKGKVIKAKSPAVAGKVELSRKDRPGGRPNLKSKPLTAKESNEKKKRKVIKRQKTTEKQQNVQENSSRSQLEKKDSALKYLATWSTRTLDGSQWKFNKNNQNFLIKHMYNIEMVSKDDFVVLLEYLKDLKGKRRTTVIEDARVIYNKSDLENTDKDAIPKDAKIKNKRSRKLIESLV